jgi:hypothetical protein
VHNEAAHPPSLSHLEASRAALGLAAAARGAGRLACMEVAVSAAQPPTPGEHILQPEWPADKVERRAVAALIPFQAAPIVILTMRALIVMSLCTAMVAESAFAKQRFNPTQCSQTAYLACLHDVGPYCRKDAASEPAATRAVEHTACLARYRSTCREIHCD